MFPSSIFLPLWKALVKWFHSSKGSKEILQILCSCDTGTAPGAETSPKLGKFGSKPPSPHGAAGRGGLIPTSHHPPGPCSPPQALHVPTDSSIWGRGAHPAAPGEEEVRAGESSKSGPRSPLCPPAVRTPPVSLLSLLFNPNPQVSWPRQ